MSSTEQAALFGTEVDQWCVGPDELAALFNVSVSMVHKYVKNYGMPKAGRGSFNVRECIRWYIEYLNVNAGEDQHGGNEDRSNSRKLYIDAQTERTQLEISERKGLLIPRDQVAHVLHSLAVIVSTQLDGLAPRVAGEVANMTDPGEIQEVIFDECRSVRANIADQIREFSSGNRAVTSDHNEDHPAAAEA